MFLYDARRLWAIWSTPASVSACGVIISASPRCRFRLSAHFLRSPEERHYVTRAIARHRYECNKYKIGRRHALPTRALSRLYVAHTRLRCGADLLEFGIYFTPVLPRATACFVFGVTGHRIYSISPPVVAAESVNLSATTARVISADVYISDVAKAFLLLIRSAVVT